MVEHREVEQPYQSSPVDLTDDDYQRLAHILVETIPSDRRVMWAGKVMAYLGAQAAQSLAAGRGLPRVPTKAIHQDLGGNPKQEPSAWLSSIWKDIEERHYPEIEEQLKERCGRAGLKAYPVLEKERGASTFYRLGARRLAWPSQNLIEEDAAPREGIRYTVDLTLEMSWLGRRLFRQGLRWTPSRRYGYITWQIIFLLGLSVVELAACLYLWFRREPLTGQDMMMFALAVVFPIGGYHHLSGVFRLFEDRIMIAPEWALAWKELGATIEISRTRDATESTIHVRRYSAPCPICGWMIKLDQGAPEYSRRIVGRCEEHPREHVYSFDRTTRLGQRLGDSHLDRPG